MKKTVCLLLVAMFALLPSCGKEEDFTDSTVKEIPADPATDTEAVLDVEEESTEIPEEKKELVFTVESHVGTGSTDVRNIGLKYPVLQNTGNDEAVNAALMAQTESIMLSDITYVFGGAEAFTYEISDVYLTFSNDSFASFMLVGSFYPEGGAHPTEFVRTVNISFADAEVYSAADTVTDFGALSALFTSGDTFKLKETGNASLDTELAGISRERLVRSTPVYFIDDGTEVYLAVSVETSHVLGDHAEYTAKLSDVSDLLSDEILTLTKGN